MPVATAPGLPFASRGRRPPADDEVDLPPPSFADLQAVLDDPAVGRDAGALGPCVAAYHARALAMNAERGRRTGQALRRVVYLLSGNRRKTDEYRVSFDRYGIEVCRAPVSACPQYIAALLAPTAPGVRVLAVHREQNRLYDVNTGARLDGDLPADSRAVLNVSTLTAFSLVDGTPARRSYTASCAGTLVAAGGGAAADAFGWDDRFVPPGLRGEPSYCELRRRGHKVSPRDMVVGQYITEQVHYPTCRDLTFAPVRPSAAIDFAQTVADYLARVPHYNLPTLAEVGLDRMLDAVLDQGLHWRAAKNRREGTYWYPGLNAGIPLTPKRDAFHEETYLFHDLGHFLVRDLIFTGAASARHRQVYILYRMMSEAMTMVLTDMLFVDAVRRSGFAYDYGKRRIYPLFAASGLSFAAPERRWASLEALLHANVEYCVRGSTTAYEALLGTAPAAVDALRRFREKYEPFFVEDFRWTAHNFSNMAARAEEARAWWQRVAPLQTLGGVRLTTIDSFMAGLRSGDGDLVDQVREAIFRDLLRPIFAAPQPVAAAGAQARLRATFVRYMAGQLAALARYAPLVAETPVFERLIVGALRRVAPAIDLAGIQEVRAIYDDYLGLLLRRGLINGDDFETFCQVFPLFDPLYMSYDRDRASYPSLRQVARETLLLPEPE